MTGGDPQPVHVRGGSHGVAADCAALRALGGACGTSALELGAAALRLHGYLADPALAVAGLARLPAFADFEAELLAALDGPCGLSLAAARLGELEVLLRGAASLYEAADRLGAALHDVVHGLAALPVASSAAELSLLSSGDPVAAAQVLVALDPELADVLVDALGVPAELALLSGSLPDGHARIADTGVDEAAEAGRAPRSLRDILGELGRRNDGPHGAVDVRIVSGGASGRRHVIVDITGTKSASLRPDADVTGLITDGKALIGERTTYEDGVLLAMRRAGVTKQDEVMLVGHSEGGMVAVTAARDALRSGTYNVTHVITAGAPVGRTAGELPDRVQVLALENRRDVVPHLDGRQNPDRPNLTTVTGDRGDGSILGDHRLADSYVPLAGDTDASRAGSVRDFVRSIRGYLSGTHVETHTYVVSRRQGAR